MKIESRKYAANRFNLIAILVIAVGMLLLGIAVRTMLANQPAFGLTNNVAKAETHVDVPVVAEPQVEVEALEPQTANHLSSGFGDVYGPHITAQLEMQPEVQNANGVVFTASNFIEEEGHVFVNVCYQIAGPGTWDINAASLLYTGGEVSNLEVHETSNAPAHAQNENGQRCFTLDFQVPSSADLSALTLRIDAVGLVAPMEGTECEVFTARLRNAPEVRQNNIQTSCQQQANGPQITVTGKPSTMSMDEANDIVGRAISGWIDGPWVFTGSITNN